MIVDVTADEYRHNAANEFAIMIKWCKDDQNWLCY